MVGSNEMDSVQRGLRSAFLASCETEAASLDVPLSLHGCVCRRMMDEEGDERIGKKNKCSRCSGQEEELRAQYTCT